MTPPKQNCTDFSCFFNNYNNNNNNNIFNNSHDDYYYYGYDPTHLLYNHHQQLGHLCK